jgi:hypothetical protein
MIDRRAVAHEKEWHESRDNQETVKSAERQGEHGAFPFERSWYSAKKLAQFREFAEGCQTSVQAQILARKQLFRGFVLGVRVQSCAAADLKDEIVNDEKTEWFVQPENARQHAMHASYRR